MEGQSVKCFVNIAHSGSLSCNTVGTNVLYYEWRKLVGDKLGGLHKEGRANTICYF